MRITQFLPGAIALISYPKVIDEKMARQLSFGLTARDYNGLSYFWKGFN